MDESVPSGARAAVASPSPREERAQLLLEQESALQAEREGRARTLASVIELRHISMPRSKSVSLRARRQRVSVDDFELLKLIGRGAFGEVRLCRERATRTVFAMKVMQKQQLATSRQICLYDAFAVATRTGGVYRLLGGSTGALGWANSAIVSLHGPLLHSSDDDAKTGPGCVACGFIR